MSTPLRAGLLALAVAALVAAFVVLRPDDEPPSPTKAAVTVTPTPSPAVTEVGGDATPVVTSTPTPKATADPGPLLTTAGVRKIRVRKGQAVRFRARSSKADEIHVHGYDLTREVDPGQT